MKESVKWFLCLIASVFVFSNTSYAEDISPKKPDPRSKFEFDENGNVKTKTGKAEKTFSFPPLKTGFIIDFKNRDIMPHLSLELKRWKSFALDLGVAQSRAFLSVSWELVPIVKILKLG